MTRDVTLAELDAALASWEERLARVDENLLALESDTAYRAVVAARDRLVGASQIAARAATDAVAHAFDLRARLGEVIARARAVRKSVHGIAFWSHEDKRRQALALLFGPSITVDAAPSLRALERALLEGGAAKLTPEQAIVGVERAYDHARASVKAIEQAWSGIEGAAERASAALARADAEASARGERAAFGDDLARVALAIERARGRGETDPVAALEKLAVAVAREVDELAQRVAALAETRARAEALVGRADALRVELERAHAAAIEAARAATNEFGPVGVASAVADDLVLGLDGWRVKLDDAIARRRWGAAAVGLGRWIAAAEGYLANDSSVAAALARLRARRDELRGRLLARRAQAAALVARGAPARVGLDADAEEALRLLSRRPTLLDEAERRVDRYEDEVVKMATRVR